MSVDESLAGTSVTETDRAVGLFTFLKEFVDLRTKTIRDFSHYAQDGQIIWANEIPRDDGCSCIAWHRDAPVESADEAWIEVRKPRLMPPPEPPESVRAWVQREQLGDSSLEVPELRPFILAESDDDPQINLVDNPSVQRNWDDYVQCRWRPWAARDRREQTILQVYTNLFSAFQLQQRERERFELVFGLGLLCWIPPDGQAVRRHLITVQASVSFDAESGKLTVTPAGDGVPPSIEQDMLDPLYLPDSRQLRKIDQTLEEFGDSVWRTGPLDGLLKSWVHSASRTGEYSAALEPPERPSSAPVVHLSPALILRRRTQRSFIDACEGIIDWLKGGRPVPKSVSDFISVSGEMGESDLSVEGGNIAASGETYFPLPANKEQLEILRRLNASRGVLVQGPPGTGKSHTIVNLICHSLATGKRVLVTSHTVRALKVLRGMISKHAPNLAPLTVVQLGGDREAQHETEKSVQGITVRQNTWSFEESRTRVSTLERDLDSKRRHESTILRDLRLIREQETLPVEMFGYSGKLARIAQQLRHESKSLSWVGDEAPECVDPPLSTKEFDELISLANKKDISKWEANRWTSIELKELPDIKKFESDVCTEREARKSFGSDAQIRERPEYIPLSKICENDQDKLAVGLREIWVEIERIKQCHLPWTENSTKEILGGVLSVWKQLLTDSSMSAKSITESGKWLDANPLDLEPHCGLRELLKLRADIDGLLTHMEGDRGWGFWLFRAKVVKRALYVRELRIGGRQCDTVDTIRDALKWVDAKIKDTKVRDNWAFCHKFKSNTFINFALELEDICMPIRYALAAVETKAMLSKILRRAPACPEPDWSDSASLLRFIETLSAIEREIRYSSATARIDESLQNIHAQGRRGNLDPVSKQLQASIKGRDTSAYANAWHKARDNAELANLLIRKLQLLKRLSDHAPRLACGICDSSTRTDWEKRKGQFDHAWNWSRAHARLTQLTRPNAEDKLRLELDRTKREKAHILEQIAAERAWMHCFSRMTEHHRQHLIAWSKSVRSIGKGTGKYAHRHRLNAINHLKECRPSIPAWVMPLHRVAEMTVKSDPEQFDLAIIDEASQSGPEGLLLAWLAKKLVVVGDDKQIRPTYAGVNFEVVNQLRERYISGLPHSDAYSVDHSFFDLAEIRFAGRVRLREHFRCMPEIIGFSNRISYADEPLLPLRQYGIGRLEPTVTTRLVGEGYQNGTGAGLVNIPEAEAVTEQIVRICGEDAYEGKNLGVISLVGNAQAKAIESLLIARLGVKEIEKRQLVCGDAYAFQGDERDVILLSLVSAPRDRRRIRAMTDADTQRRFNVAASRARDQLYLFHTATLADLNPTCMRYQLLQYCLNPTGEIMSGPELSELERSAIQDDRQVGNQPEPFESWFELDVFLLIKRRGYIVVPQFKVGGFRIDLVVQGSDGSLAVECDGDYWHGEDRYEQDVARQRDLERCGWVFWRVRESLFRLDPDGALSSLWETLEAHRIVSESGSVCERGEGEVPRSTAKPVDTQSTKHRSSTRQPTLMGTDGSVLPEEPARQTTASQDLPKHYKIFTRKN